jgi:hypothetical protein
VADDYTAVPTPEWQRIDRVLANLKGLALLTACILLLLITTLLQKGVLTSWSDLFRLAPDGA